MLRRRDPKSGLRDVEAIVAVGKKEHLSFKGKEVCLWLDEKRSCDVHQGIPDDKMPLVLAHHIEQFHKHGRLEFYDGCPCGGCT